MLNSTQMDPQNKSGSILWVAWLPIVMVVSAIVGLLLFSPDEPAGSFWCRSDLFWVRLAWYETILILAWIFGVVIPLKELHAHRQQIGGGFAIASAIVLNAAALSLIILFGSLFLPDTRFFRNLPIVIQLIIIVICLLKITFLKQAQALQNDGMNLIPKKLKSPDELCAFITICEAQPDLDPDLAKKLKGSRERIKYSVPKVGKVATSTHYESVVKLVDATYDEMMSGKRETIGGSLDSLDRAITLLIVECKN